MADANVNLVGLEINLSQGAPAVTVDAIINLAGQSITVDQGEPYLPPDVVVFLQGQNIEIEQGEPIIPKDVNFELPGLRIIVDENLEGVVNSQPVDVYLVGQEIVLEQNNFSFESEQNYDETGPDKTIDLPFVDRTLELEPIDYEINLPYEEE